MPSLKLMKIDDLPVGQSWYTKAKDGSVSLLAVKKEYGPRLSDNATLALALTQACCERGIGKVYFMLPNLDRSTSQSTTEEFEAYQISTVSPGLVYVPEAWDAQSKRDWEQTVPADQLHACAAEHGWVHGNVPVLPFAACITSGKPKMVPHFPERTDALVHVFLTPYVYLGQTEDLKKAFDLVTVKVSEGKPKEYSLLKKEAFKKFKMKSLESVVQELDLLCRQKPALLQRYVLCAQNTIRVKQGMVKAQAHADAAAARKWEAEQATRDASKQRNKDILEGDVPT